MQSATTLTTPLPPLSNAPQAVAFSETEGVCSAELFSSNVLVTTDAGKHNHGSSKVKLKNLVDYNWELRYYTGQLLAVHMGGKYLAYAMKERMKPSEYKPRDVARQATTGESQNEEQGGKKTYSPADLIQYSVSPHCREPPQGLENFPEEVVKSDVPNNPNPGSWSGMVRVIHRTTDKRVLLKGMKGEIQDLDFAHIENQVILASIDEYGHTYIHKIELVDDALRGSLVLEIVNDCVLTSARHRLVWCPYIPDDEDNDSDPEDDNARLLLTSSYNIARVYKTWGIVSGLAAGVHTVTVKSILETENPNMVTVSDHTAAIIDAAFSPDGTALATASTDGQVMFFQVYMHDDMTPRCLHRWTPHDGKPLSCLFFLDNHKIYSSDVQFWKFAVTGAERSTILKIWCCKSWKCLQTITFAPDISPELSAEPVGFKAVLDSGAEYLVLSDFKRRCLYVLHMWQEAGDYIAYCKSISEFLLPFPVLSFAVAESGTRTIKCSSSCGDPYHANGGNGEDGGSPSVFDPVDDVEEMEPHLNGEGDTVMGVCGLKTQFKLYLLQPKGLQEGRLLYTPPPLNGTEQRSSGQSDGDMVMALSPDTASAEVMEPLNANFLQQQSQQLKNILMRARNQQGGLMGRPDSPPCAPPATQLNLMTPDAFSSPGKRDEEDPPISITPDQASEQLVSVHTKTAHTDFDTEEAPPKYTSVGSSPSREVQEIFSLKDSEYFKDELVEAHVSPEPASDVNLHNGNTDLLNNVYIEQEITKPNISNTKETIWPQITIAQINEANQRKASSDKSANQSISNSIVNVGDMSNVDLSINEEDNASDENRSARRTEQLSLCSQDRSRLDALELKLEKITEMMAEQNRLLHTMREERADLDIRETIEQALHAHTTQTTLAIDNAFDERWGRVEMAAASAGAAAADAVSAAMARVLEPLTRSLQHEFATRMSTTDSLLRDNIEKLVNSKSIQESLGNSVAKVLSVMVRDSFRDIMAQTLVPTVEKAVGQIFKQVNQAFQNGTKEFAANTEVCARAAAERGSAAAVESLRSALEHHAEQLVAFSKQQPQPIAQQQLTPVVHNAVRGVLEQEMSRWREQAASVLELSRSQTPITPRVAHTPHQVVDRQKSRRIMDSQQKCYRQIKHSTGDGQYNMLQVQLAQISSLLSNGDVNSAFQVALSASDLSLVVHACRAADPARVFSPTCQLKQHVLLSLVQQLAADMTTDTQLKHRYLEEAVINLDPLNAVTREHIPAVVRDLNKQLSNFLASNPSHQLSRQMKMLLMATESLLSAAM